MKDVKARVEQLRRRFEKENLWAEVDQEFDLPVAVVDISWGDWKHEHLRAKYIAQQMGFTFVKSEEYEEDGSDCYSARHYFLV